MTKFELFLPGHSKSRRLVWLGVFAALMLALWPEPVMLAATLLSGEVVGEVRLQGRLDHGGVEIQIQGEPGSEGLESFVASPVQTTDSGGGFGFEGQGTLTITAHKEGYLDAQAIIEVEDDPAALGPTTLYGGEVTGDNLVDIGDLAYLGAHFDTADTLGDINGDGRVDILDLSMAAANFKMSGPTPWGE